MQQELAGYEFRDERLERRAGCIGRHDGACLGDAHAELPRPEQHGHRGVFRRCVGRRAGLRPRAERRGNPGAPVTEFTTHMVGGRSNCARPSSISDFFTR